MGLVNEFIDRAEENGTSTELVRSEEEAGRRVVELAGAAAVTRWDDQIVAGLDLAETSPEKAELSLVVASYGIAPSGSLVLVHGAGRSAGAALLPPRQIVLLSSVAIVKNLIDALLPIYSDSDAIPANIVIVTGPSRTRDIGLVPVIGVHAPKELHVIVISAQV